MMRNEKVHSSFWHRWWGKGLSILLKAGVVAGVIAAVVGVVIPKAEGILVQGSQVARMSERSVIQRTLLAMMADRGITGVTGMASRDVSTNAWGSAPRGPRAAPLADYLEDATSAYFYCFNSRGVITQQDDRPSPCPESPRY